MPNPFQTKKVKDLIKSWNSKLESSGFEDAENFDLQEPLLKQWTNTSAIHMRLRNAESTLDYLRCAADVLYHRSYKFRTKKERRIWELHCEGLPIREIAEDLRVTIYRAGKTIKKIQKDNGLPFIENKSMIDPRKRNEAA